jgi:hypothetical protein
MANDSEGIGPGSPAEFGQVGSEQPERGQPRPLQRRRDYPYATDRHLEDLTAQRDRFEAACSQRFDEILRLSGRLTELSAANARLEEANRNMAEALESERLQRGLIGILATVMAAIGGGFVSVVSGWQQWAMASLLFVGCSFMFYNSLLNLSAEVRQHGIWVASKRLWFGR